MRVRFALFAIGVLAATGWIVTWSAPPSGGGKPDGPDRYGPGAPPRALLVAEDGRATTREEAAPILQALADSSPTLVRRAVLALGRLENPLFAHDIRRVVTHADAGVRAEAIHALAHATGSSAAELVPLLRVRLEQERDPAVRGTLLETLGRLAYPTPAERSAVEPLLSSGLAEGETAIAEKVGAAEGLENLVRRARGSTYVPSVQTLDALRVAALPARRSGVTGDAARLRRLALSALNAAGAVDDLHARALRDRDGQVRRLAVAGTGRDHVAADLRAAVVARALRDPSAMVRYEALRVHARHLAQEDCRPELAALDDPSAHVALAAIDALATACPGDGRATEALTAIVTGSGILSPGRGNFSQFLNRQKPVSSGSSTGSRIPDPGSRPGAHALVSLARRDAGAARRALPAFVAHPEWQVRAAAARAAAVLGDAGTLRALVSDAHDNVREEAIGALAGLAARESDPLFLAALKRPAYQVVIAAARALAGTPDRSGAAAALLETLAVLTAERRDTSRDARAALLTRLEDVGGSAHADALRPYLADVDPAIARRAAQVLSAWTGSVHEPEVTRVTPVPLPPQDDLDQLPPGMRVVMADGRSFDVTFDTWDATVTVWRVVRLVRQGYYDGLTFHRSVANFVIQGGSPGANEFVGDGPFMRDECGARSNLRGSIGISTRGRDTGDAQFYVNLVDNERLDHTYPVFGSVERGIAVIDTIAGGDVIRQIELLPPR